MPTLAKARAQRFQAYVERLSSALGHQDRHGLLRDCVTGLCLPRERKSVKPMAARVDPRHVCAHHQSMHHFVANAAWDESVSNLKALPPALPHRVRPALCPPPTSAALHSPWSRRHSIHTGIDDGIDPARRLECGWTSPSIARIFDTQST